MGRSQRESDHNGRRVFFSCKSNGFTTSWLIACQPNLRQLLRFECQLAKMFPTVAAVWVSVFHFLEWTESLCFARLNFDTRGLLEPILLELTATAVRRASGVRGHRVAYLSEHFPGFNIVRLWRLSCGYLKEILERLAHASVRRHLVCFFQVQTFDNPDVWQPRGTAVAARFRRRELARSPFREHCDLIHDWGLALYVVREICPSWDSHLLVET